jgi:hypothetical protein
VYRFIVAWTVQLLADRPDFHRGQSWQRSTALTFMVNDGEHPQHRAIRQLNPSHSPANASVY